MAPSSINGDPRSASEVGTGRRDDRDDFKAQKPDLFYGDREKLDNWLNQLAMYFLFNPMPANRKSLFATTFMRGRVEHWIKPHLTLFLEHGPTKEGDPNGLFSNYEVLKDNLRLVFGVTNDKNTAIRVIQHLTQRTAASEYAVKFQEFAQITGWDQQALMTMFRRGLKENVKDELMRTGAATDDLESLIRTAINIDDQLYEQA